MPKRHARRSKPARRHSTYEPRVRRDKWEWPDPERHPSIGVYRGPRGWRSRAGNWHNSESIAKWFSDSKYGGPEAALRAAQEWYADQVERRKISRRGWKLGPNQAGNVVKVHSTVNGTRYYGYRAELTHGGTKFAQSFGILRYGEDGAREWAEYALELWRKQIAAIAKMPKERQMRIAWGLEEFSL